MNFTRADYARGIDERPRRMRRGVAPSYAELVSSALLRPQLSYRLLLSSNVRLVARQRPLSDIKKAASALVDPAPSAGVNSMIHAPINL